MGKEYYRGYAIEILDGDWVYSDTKEKVELNKNRKCGHCDLHNTKEGHDGCIGEIKNLMNACCGHGNIDEMYIQFLDGSCISGVYAQIIINILKGD